MAKVMISIPDDLLERVDARAKELGTSRSGLMRDAVEEKLGKLSPEEFDALLAEIRELAKDLPPGPDSTQIVREMRDSR